MNHPWPDEEWQLVIDGVAVGTLIFADCDQPSHICDWKPSPDFYKYASYFRWGSGQGEDSLSTRASLRLGSEVIVPYVIWIDEGATTARMRLSHDGAMRIMAPMRKWSRDQGIL